MANENPTYKAIAIPSRVLLHPDEPVRLGGDLYRWSVETATTMRRASTQGQSWRDAVDVNLVRDPSDLRVDTFLAVGSGEASALALREDGMMLLSEVDDATAGFLCHLSKTLKTTFMLAPIPPSLPGFTQLLKGTRTAVIGSMKRGPFEDAYYWTNIAHVNEAPDVVKRYKIKTGEIAPDADKKADAKAKKAAAAKTAVAGGAAVAPETD
jgi:hypothetical protein